jgi:hypothetical protein
MILAQVLLAALLPMVAPEDLDATLGVKTVTVAKAGLSTIPNATRKVVAHVVQGDEVNVIGYEGSFAKVKRSDGPDLYIGRTALTPKEKYVKAPTNEKEMMEMKGQGYEAGRFDPETENALRKDRGPEMGKAYDGVTAWETRQAWNIDKIKVSQRLDDFRKAGKLAEYTAVK